MSVLGIVCLVPLCRVPRLGGAGKNAAALAEPFATECKEYVRSHLIGQQVRHLTDTIPSTGNAVNNTIRMQVQVSVEYVRKFDTGSKLFASVYFGKISHREDAPPRPSQNIAQLLICEGLASTVKHRGEEPRAEAYDMLMADEMEAVRRQRGMHSKKESATSAAGALNDVSTDGRSTRMHGRVGGLSVSAGPADGWFALSLGVCSFRQEGQGHIQRIPEGSRLPGSGEIHFVARSAQTITRCVRLWGAGRTRLQWQSLQSYHSVGEHLPAIGSVAGRLELSAYKSVYTCTLHCCLQIVITYSAPRRQVRCHNIPKRDALSVSDEVGAPSGVATWAETARKHSRLHVLQRQVKAPLT